MKDFSKIGKHLCFLLGVGGLALLLMFSLWGIVSLAHADGPLTPGPGYLDFALGTTVLNFPTALRPESKLWWNDGFWWGIMWNDSALTYRIYRLNWGTQIWEDTGVSADSRPLSRADVLWDEAANKLYVVSNHVVQTPGFNQNDPGLLFRYTYNATLQTYTLDSAFVGGVPVNQDRTRALVIDKDSTGRLWITYVSRRQAVDPNKYEVYVNTSSSNGLTWGTPFTLSVAVPVTATTVATGDLASLIAFTDNITHRIGIMWSNQLSNTLHFAYHDDSNSNRQTGWTLESAVSGQTQTDEINLKSLQKTASGQVFAAIQTANTISTSALIGVVARDTDGTFSFHEYSQVQHNDRNPILLIDEGDVSNSNDDKIYTFVTNGGGGGKICYKSLNIITPLSSMGNFTTLPVNCGITLMQDDTYNRIDNTTTTKQNVNRNTGIVVLATHDISPTRFYVHGVLGDPSPVVTARAPGINATNVPISTLVSVTFSKPMSATTLNETSFLVANSSGPITGTISYDSTTRTATFTPNSLLKVSRIYTVTLTQDIKDTSGKELNEGFEAAFIREQWRFTTAAAVQFNLTVSTVGSGSVGLNPSGGLYDAGTVVTTTAIPAPGYQFDSWSGDLTGSTNPMTVTMTGNKSVTATFTLLPPGQFNLTVSTVGSGSVALNPPGGIYTSGTVVTTTAIPDVGYVFSGWNGDVTGSTNPVTVTMTSNKSVTATFAAPSPPDSNIYLPLIIKN